MNADVAGGAIGDLADRLARSARSIPPRTVPVRDERLDPTPIAFTQYVEGTWLFWSVHEVDARTVPGRLGARCLLFSRRECIRRVWDYPADWRDLDAADLAVLSWHR